MKNMFARFAGSLVTVSALAAVTAPVFNMEAFAQNGGGGGGRGGDRGGDSGGRRMGGGMGNMMMPPSISNQLVERMEKSLALTPDQAVAAKELHDGYNDQARAIQEKLREQMESIRQEFQDTQDPTVWEKAQKHSDEARAARKALDATFMSDYKLLLTPEQANQWPSVERSMRRDQGLRRGFISGERVDVVRLAESIEMPDDTLATINATLEEYSEAVDREIVKRDEGMETRMKEMAEIRASGDFEKMQEVIERGREASVRVRDVNRKYARQVADMLPEDLKAKFDDAFKRESFPDVYRESLTQRSVNEALKFADLTEDQKSSINTIKGNLERDLKSLNDELAAAVEEGEMTFNIGQGFGNRDRGPTGDLRREKRDLETASLDALKKVLTPEQIERMPKREEGDRGGDRANNGGGDRGNNRGGDRANNRGGDRGNGRNRDN